MSATTPTVTVANMDIGPCQVFYNAIDIGGTHGDVHIKFKYEKSDITADQFGPKTKLDQAISGMECTVTTEFLETRDKTHFALLFPNATFVGSPPNLYLDFKDATANRQLPLAHQLTLHPLVEIAASKNQDWTFWKAVPSEDSEYVFSPTKQASLKINWMVYLDLSPTPTNPARMFRAGDLSL